MSDKVGMSIRNLIDTMEKDKYVTSSELKMAKNLAKDWAKFQSSYAKANLGRATS